MPVKNKKGMDKKVKEVTLVPLFGDNVLMPPSITLQPNPYFKKYS